MRKGTPDRNDGRCCDAVLRVLEQRTGERRADLHTDPSGGAGAGRVDVCVQLGSDHYVLEHTRIEPFEDAVTIGIKFSDFVAPIEERLSGVLLGPERYIISLDPKLGGKKGKQIAAIQKALIDWISAEAPRLYDRAATSGLLTRRAQTKGKFPDLLPYSVGLSCNLSDPPSDTEPVRFGVIRITDNDLEQQGLGRLRRALEAKCPKLKRCKDRGALTVLVLKCGDIFFDHVSIRRELDRAAEERGSMPDPIYLV